jgi:quinol monooxygenase YgiN
MILAVRHTTADFAAWKRVFDEHAAVRKEHGATGHTLLQSADDPNTVTILNRFPDRASIDAFASDPSLAEAMKRAGVVSAPEITIWDETEETPY